ncbi:MAG TPA: acetoacetate decarboxylase family protein [Marmoricola sp.]|jgi:acetoacetate decarboxylase|nr:acetoacetate decarboxylase family protein [Marmoricola sp.]
MTVQWISAPNATGDVSYPAAPWNMTGQLWLSLFKVRAGDHPDREPGIYGVALVKYEEPSPLTYGELLVARPVNKAVSITDIWVDSAPSMHGGRDLWAIPKDLCDFSFTSTGSGLLTRTLWTAELDGVPIATASFADASRLVPRLKFKGSTWQQRPASDPNAGEEVTAALVGSSKAAPCRAHWDFNPDGALGWLAGKRTLASFRQADFQMSFG